MAGQHPMHTQPAATLLACRLFERGLQQAAAFEPRDLVNILTGCAELRLEMQPQELWVRSLLCCYQTLPERGRASDSSYVLHVNK